MPPGSVGFLNAAEVHFLKRFKSRCKFLTLRKILHHVHLVVYFVVCDMRQRTLLPLHETPFLCRAVWYTEPPAVRICHGGCSGNQVLSTINTNSKENLSILRISNVLKLFLKPVNTHP